MSRGVSLPRCTSEGPRRPFPVSAFLATARMYPLLRTPLTDRSGLREAMTARRRRLHQVREVVRAPAVAAGCRVVRLAARDGPERGNAARFIRGQPRAQQLRHGNRDEDVISAATISTSISANPCSRRMDEAMALSARPMPDPGVQVCAWLRSKSAPGDEKRRAM